MPSGIRRIFQCTGLFTAALFCICFCSAFNSYTPALITLPVRNDDFQFDGIFLPEKYHFSSNGVFSGGGNNKRISRVKAQWGIFSNADFLVIGICTPRGGDLVAIQNFRDGKLWEDDSYEVYLTDSSGLQGYHFIFNSQNGLYDSRFNCGIAQPAWNGQGIEIKNTFPEDNWSAEIRIPFSELGVLPSGGEWKIGVYRASPGKRANEGISPFQETFYDHQNFTRLNWDSRAVRSHMHLDLDALANQKLGVQLQADAFSDATAEWEIAVTPLDYGLNDIYNQPKEELLSSGKIPDGTAFEQNISAAAIPQAGTLRMCLRRDAVVLFERQIAYDCSLLNRLVISSAWSSLDHAKLCAEVVLPDINLATQKCVLSLADSGNRIVVQTEVMHSGGSHTLALPVDDIHPGGYILKLAILDSTGTEIQSDSGPFALLPERAEWADNRLGCSDGQVPQPWTPMEIKNNQIQFWGRQYLLNEGGLPESMTGVSGLAARKLRFISKGESFQAKSFQWLRKQQDVAEFLSEWTLNDHSLKLRGTLEYDGMFWLQCNFQPARGQKLPDVDFVWEVPGDHASLVYTSEHMAHNSGRIPEQGWHKDLLTFLPMFWVGNEQGGIYFCADDLRGWNLQDYSRSAEIAPLQNHARQVVVHLLESEANQVNQKYQLEFAVQITPSRPMPENWRSFQINGGTAHNIRQYEDRVTKLFSVPTPVQADARVRIENWREKGVNAVPYLALLAVSPFTDEYRWFSEQWRMLPQQRPRFQPEDYLTHTFICPNAEGFNDYFLWQIDQMVDQLDANGLYFDYAQPSGFLCSNPAHGCQWIDSFGKQRSSMRLKATRELVKRIYTLLKRKRPHGSLMVLHNSGAMIPPVHTFCDITWNGEQTAQAILNQNLSYQGIFELDKYCVEQRHEPWGVVVCFLPQFLRSLQAWDPNRYGDYAKIGWKGMVDGFVKDPASHAATWHLAGLTLLHDSMFSGDWGMGGRLRDVRTLMAELGWDDTVEFHGYFKPGKLFRIIAPETSQVLLSSYKAPRGFLLVAFNDTQQQQGVSIRLPDSVRSEQIKDGISGQSITVLQQTIQLSIPAKQPALVVIQQENDSK